VAAVDVEEYEPSLRVERLEYWLDWVSYLFGLYMMKMKA
jgi:hypothetical protein